jgi:hypothetical protein
LLAQEIGVQQVDARHHPRVATAVGMMAAGQDAVLALDLVEPRVGPHGEGRAGVVAGARGNSGPG